MYQTGQSVEYTVTNFLRNVVNLMENLVSNVSIILAVVEFTFLAEPTPMN